MSTDRQRIVSRAGLAAAIAAGTLLLLPAIASAAPPDPRVAPAPPAGEIAPDPYAAFDAVFAAGMRTEHLPAMVVGVVRDGRLVHLYAQGNAALTDGQPVDGTTRFRIASMSKAFTALAILSLRDAGKLALDAPAARYVPELRSLKPATADAAPITVRQLLNHVAGFVTDDPWGDRQLATSPDAFTRLIAAGWPSARAPGLSYEYSNLGYALLGRIVTKVSGRPYQDYIRDTILRPLGMNDTDYDPDRARERLALGYRWADGGWTPEPILADGEFGAMGGVVTTADDYARWAAFLLSAWPPRDEAERGPVRRSTVRELASATSPPTAVWRTAADGRPCAVAGAYGFGFRVNDDCALGRVIHHTGGLPGYGSNILLLPDAGVAIFSFANRTYAPMFGLNRTAAEALLAAGLATPRAEPVSPMLAAAGDAVLRAYAEGGFTALAPMLAVNVPLDRDLAARDADLAELRALHGRCAAGTIAARSAMAGKLTMRCERGTITAELVLAPTPAPLIQTIAFEGY